MILKIFKKRRRKKDRGERRGNLEKIIFPTKVLKLTKKRPGGSGITKGKKKTENRGVSSLMGGRVPQEFRWTELKQGEGSRERGGKRVHLRSSKIGEGEKFLPQDQEKDRARGNGKKGAVPSLHQKRGRGRDTGQDD